MYKIKLSDGREWEAITFDGAVCLLADYYPELEVGHDGDLDGGGDRTLCWANEADSVNDDGARAVASIYRVEDES